MKLIDCQFCGSKATIFFDDSPPFSVRCCNHMVARIHFLGEWCKTKEEAAKEWNKRMMKIIKDRGGRNPQDMTDPLGKIK